MRSDLNATRFCDDLFRWVVCDYFFMLVGYVCVCMLALLCKNRLCKARLCKSRLALVCKALMRKALMRKALMRKSGDGEPIVQAFVSEARKYILELQEDAPPGFSPPDLFCCPITLTIMADPVRTRCGHVFEREALDNWILTCGLDHACCPLTRRPLRPADVAPAPDMAEAILEWILSQEKRKGFATRD